MCICDVTYFSPLYFAQHYSTGEWTIAKTYKDKFAQFGDIMVIGYDLRHGESKEHDIKCVACETCQICERAKFLIYTKNNLLV